LKEFYERFKVIFPEKIFFCDISWILTKIPDSYKLLFLVSRQVITLCINKLFFYVMQLLLQR